MFCLRTGVKEDMTFNSSMSEEDFIKWLKSKGVSEKDCNTLSGKIIIQVLVLTLLSDAIPFQRMVLLLWSLLNLMKKIMKSLDSLHLERDVF